MKKLIATIMTCVLLISIAPTRVSATSEMYKAYINEVADMYDICPELIQAMIFYESNYNPSVVSSDGAIGLMQVMPKYNKDRMKRLGITDLYDPYQNILCGVDILAELAEDYEVYEALVAYNCGRNSKTLKRVQNGGTWAYADKILEYSAELEAKNE